ncbi:ATP-binding protein, partial [Streptomyces sp. NPDC005209]|uniref:ATP-binding protein n=1 Tax=Streptomyces sp. NPDC005209 TaxID=3156715 RepID=UPI0033AD3A68
GVTGSLGETKRSTVWSQGESIHAMSRLPGASQDSTLICEVSDGSGTAPHLRRARTFDEGGRGLLLVAQCAQRWGTRHHADGKTIWAEMDLPDKRP